MKIIKNISIFNILIISILLLFVVSQSTGVIHREHKVHNIVLYPEKHSWCNTLQIKQVISYPGCKSEEIDNNVCVGTCFSYSIPHTEPSDPGEVIVPYCDRCQPSDTTWHHVTLECNKESQEVPPTLVKRVQIINNCSCSPCEKNRIQQTRILGQEDDQIIQQNDIPDILSILNTRNETNLLTKNKHGVNFKSIMNHKIISMLKNIQEKNSKYDKEQLRELLNTIQVPDNKFSEKNIAEFVESLNSENIELDLHHLLEILLKLENSKHKIITKIDNIKIDQILDTNQELNKSIDELNIMKTTDINLESNFKDNINYEGSTKINDNDLIVKNNDKNIHKLNQNDTIKLNNNKHYVNENIIGYGHLKKGPHGSLIIQPDNLKHEKLNVNPHELKPNHAGTLLSYSTHPTDNKDDEKKD